MSTYGHEDAELGLRRYVTEVAAGLDVGPQSSCTEVSSIATAYIALERRFPLFPDRDAAFTWDQVYGWAAGIETVNGEDIIALSYFATELLPEPASVVEFGHRLLEGEPVGEPFPPELPICPDLHTRLARYVSPT